jgi:hypothetical protein
MFYAVARPSHLYTVPTEMPKDERRPGVQQWIKRVLSLLGLIFVVHFLIASFPGREKGADFPEFYAAAKMVLEGHGSQLYDPSTQELFQIRYSGRIGTYFIHPAFETLIYLPFALFPMDTAYSLWTWFNGALLIAIAWLVSRYVFKALSWPVVLTVCFLFPPVLLNFFQGQDAVLLLLLVTAAIVALERNKDVTAGCFLAGGLFKFHLILALVLLMACLRRVRALSAFVVGSGVLTLISIGVCGSSFLVSYSRMLSHISELPLAAIHPAQMANLRGLVALCGFRGTTGLVLTLIISLATVTWLAWLAGRSASGNGRHLGMMVCAFLLAIPLVSYHISPHDFSLLILPMALVVEHLLNTADMPAWSRICMIGSGAVLFLPPLHIILMALRLYSLICLPLLVLFACVCSEITRTALLEPAVE